MADKNSNPRGQTRPHDGRGGGAGMPGGRRGGKNPALTEDPDGDRAAARAKAAIDRQNEYNVHRSPFSDG